MSVLLSREDLTDEEVRKDALHQLERISCQGQAVAWLDRWGGALRAYLLDDGGTEALRAEVEDLEAQVEAAGGVSEGDLAGCRKALETLTALVADGAARKDLEAACDRLGGALDELLEEPA